MLFYSGLNSGNGIREYDFISLSISGNSLEEFKYSICISVYFVDQGILKIYRPKPSISVINSWIFFGNNSQTRSRLETLRFSIPDSLYSFSFAMPQSGEIYLESLFSLVRFIDSFSLKHNAEILWTEGTDKNMLLFGSYWKNKPGSETDLTIQLSGTMLMEAMARIEKSGLEL